MKYKIYAIKHNELGVIYIGITKQSLKKRFGGEYNQNVKDVKKECTIELLEETDDKARESFWIEKFREEGANLFNVYKGILPNDFETRNEDTEYFRRWRKENRKAYNDYQREYQRGYYHIRKARRENA